jgi:hypothetical protein
MRTAYHFFAHLLSLLLFQFLLSTVGQIPCQAIIGIHSSTLYAGEMRIGRFDIDVSPPIGSPLAYDPCIEVTDSLRCRGVVLLGSEQPLVLVSVDWLGIANSSHRVWRAKIAEAVGTTIERVALHTIHQHDAPRCDLTAAAFLAEIGDAQTHYDIPWIRDCMERSATAIRDSKATAVPCDRIGIGIGEVFEVASNRRLLDENGKVSATRFTACADPALRALPVGTIDPLLRSLGFWHGEKPLAVLTFYATHPQSYYRTGQANPDFPGYARNLRQQETGVLHVHFNGAGGNIGAGKWNDGSRENRQVLAEKVAQGMRLAWDNTTFVQIDSTAVKWKSSDVHLPLAEHLNEQNLLDTMRRPGASRPERVGAAEDLAWFRESLQGEKTTLQCLHLHDHRVLFMPGELFVEYQLAASEQLPNAFVAMAAYGEYGPGYIGTEIAYGQGGYETSPRASRVAPHVEKLLQENISQLLRE